MNVPVKISDDSGLTAVEGSRRCELTIIEVGEETRNILYLKGKPWAGKVHGVIGNPGNGVQKMEMEFRESRERHVDGFVGYRTYRSPGIRPRVEANRVLRHSGHCDMDDGAGEVNTRERTAPTDGGGTYGTEVKEESASVEDLVGTCQGQASEEEEEGHQEAPEEPQGWEAEPEVKKELRQGNICSNTHGDEDK